MWLPQKSQKHASDSSSVYDESLFFVKFSLKITGVNAYIVVIISGWPSNPLLALCPRVTASADRSPEDDSVLSPIRARAHSKRDVFCETGCNS